MTQPAWPSSHWQLFSSDYDTHAAYYGVQKASEVVHVQMNLPDFKVIVVNNHTNVMSAINVVAKVYGLDNSLRETKSTKLPLAASGDTTAFSLDLNEDMKLGPVLVQLTAYAANGQLLSTNLYWQAIHPEALKALDDLPKVRVSTRQTQTLEGQDKIIHLTLRNFEKTAALAIKLGVFDRSGKQVLPSYFNDNYISLMPKEARNIEIRYPASDKATEIRLRGWNIVPSTQKLGVVGN